MRDGTAKRGVGEISALGNPVFNPENGASSLPTSQRPLLYELIKSDLVVRLLVVGD